MRFQSFVLALIITLPLAAAEDFGMAGPFQNGDTVCFVGDSITHGGSYHSIVALYYATRFPDRRLTTWNCGIGGDRASGIMSDEAYRLNVDILGHRPTAATIMLGMNDVSHADYRGIPSVTPEVEARRQAALVTYEENMRKLIGVLQKSGARVTLITPSIYDEATTLPTASPNISVGGHDALGRFAEKVRGWAKEYDTGLADFDRVMNAINTREQKKDPSFTIVAADRVHPGPVGHFVMGYALLRAQGLPGEVATMAIDARQGKVAKAGNCTISEVDAGPSKVNFTSMEKALPFVVPDEAKPALALVGFQKELNDERLVVSGLEPGNYELKIDGAVVGEYSAEALEVGLNLAENEKTPQYRQSAEATKINQQRHAVGLQLRSIAVALYGMSKSKVDVSDPVAVEAKFNAQIASANQTIRARAGTAFEAWKSRDQLTKDHADWIAKLHEACRPGPHRFALAKK
ncbi:MAG: SGNH/GDSL hydrolase family protein [Verrucomicrobia bacterium]|nr:SGNH/GDSL hydrolase family protein [Verrucomicrobiota bacterium]